MKKILTGAFGFLCFLTLSAQSQPGNLLQLESEIEKVLEETGTAGAGIVLADSTGPIYIKGLGLATKRPEIPADENTMFRIGSTSKMFVALSILKLQELGKVSLKDKIRDLVPEVEFKNQWSDDTPILVEHLLEHTTGWDDIHLCEYAHNDSTPASLKEGIDFHPHSRTSRWKPGTRTAYCNSGPPVAAYIVQKLSGMDYEEFVNQTFFEPMGMESMTFRLSDNYRNYGATLYINGLRQPYWHIIMRPSGSINASATDMSRMLMFFLYRGKIDSSQIISEASLTRMEQQKTTPGAKAGLENGYGLANYTNSYRHFVYRTHGGSVNAGQADFSYLPEQKVGYVIMINGNSGDAMRRIADLIKEYQLGHLPEQTFGSKPGFDFSQLDISGYYTPINPRTQMLSFIQEISGTKKVYVSDSSVVVRNIGGGSRQVFYPIGDDRFISGETGNVAMVKAEDPLAGEVLHIGWQVLKPISAVIANGRMALALLWIVSVLLGLILGLYWGIRFLMNKIPKGSNVRIRLWPLAWNGLLVISFFFLMFGSTDLFDMLGKPGFVSITITVLTVLYAIATILSIIDIFKMKRNEIHPSVYWFCFVICLLNFSAMIFLLFEGVIGLRTWA